MKNLEMDASQLFEDRSIIFDFIEKELSDIERVFSSNKLDINPKKPISSLQHIRLSNNFKAYNHIKATKEEIDSIFALV
jgi:hypothetical protein